MQSTHSDFNSCSHGLDIVIVCDNISLPANIGGVLRLADAYGVSEVVFLGDMDRLSPKSKSVARGAQKYVRFEFKSEFYFDDRDWFCLEITNSSQPLNEFKVSNSKIGIIIGNEISGVQEALLSRFSSYHIKMFGNNSSMNVTNALSAALFQVTTA